jgi:hypothetical protein
MIVHEIDGNSTWVEPMKNRMEEEMILARQRALQQMKVQGIAPKHQVLDNEISEAYKNEIRATDMTYQLVQEHCREGHPNLERPFCRCPEWNGHNFPHESMVPSTAPDGTATLAPTAIQRQSENFSLRPRVWPPQLRCRTFRPHWDGVTCP